MTTSQELIKATPVIKWVGGKTQIIDEIFSYFPNEINTYIEPFIGGGSVIINLLLKVENNEIKCNRFICADINYCLINLYNTIKYQHKELISHLDEIKNDFNESKYKEGFYYEKREEYNMYKKTKIFTNSTGIENETNLQQRDHNVLLASLFIFLNKTGFRGVYRENSKGEYNVPYGNYKSPSIFDIENINNLSLLFNKYNVEFINQSYENIISKQALDQYSGINNFIYIDPPYYPENSTSFTKYSVGDFTHKNHLTLFNMIKSQDNFFLMSNSHTDTVVNEFKDYIVKIISAKRSINSKNPESKTNEVLITNYIVI
jgi:DNA adenine methylase